MKSPIVERTQTLSLKNIPPFVWGVAGGALGGLAFLPVMILLQPTLWARFVGLLLPNLPQVAAEFLGWIIHMVILAAWGGLFSIAFPHRDLRGMLCAGLGWAFILGWFTAMTVTLVNQTPIPLMGWVLETGAHAVYGTVLSATLIFVSRSNAK